MPQVPESAKRVARETKAKISASADKAEDNSRFAKRMYKRSQAAETYASEVAHHKRRSYGDYGTRPRQWKAVQATESRKEHAKYSSKKAKEAKLLRRASKGDYERALSKPFADRKRKSVKR